MGSGMITFLLITGLIIVAYGIAQFIRRKVYAPTYEKNVQRPGKLERFILNLCIFIEGFLLLFTILGFVMKETEMALVFGCFALILLGVTLLLRHSLNISYEENTEYFIMSTGNKEHQVFYENIIDWQPGYNEIKILDETKRDQKYIRVNIKIFKPEILLRKIADRAVEEKFTNLSETSTIDPYRKNETVNYIVNQKYGYLLEDDMENSEK